SKSLPDIRPFVSVPNAIARCSGTKTSSAKNVWLAVPRIPTVCQVSRSRTSDAGTKHRKDSTLPSSPSDTVTPIDAQSACGAPDAYDQLPLIEKPPSTRRAVPGASPPAIRESGELKISDWASSDPCLATT